VHRGGEAPYRILDTMTDIYLSVVLPCRNQADHIGEVLQRYADPLNHTGRPYELIVVPNACTDRTPEVVEKIAATDPCIRVVENPRGGWGLSVRTGLLVSRGTHLCYTNSARTEPQQIVALLDFYEKNQPCLAKVRREKRGVLARELGSWLYNLEGRILFGIGARDVNGTPKIFSRQLWEKLDLSSNGDLIDMELMAKVARLKIPVVEMPVRGFIRHGGKSSTKLKSAWKMYIGALGLRNAIAGSPKA
jgi:glycosyltransferase involved in cell wall biosynthesis